jgi:GT2 family glycosyltransferase
MKSELLATVAIITRDRLAHLEKCLCSMRAVTYPRKEILVVDSSSPELIGKTKSLAQDYKGRYVYESSLGMVTARNTALRESKGDIIAFIGDDCVVHPEWLGRLVRNYATPSVACVTGRLVPSETRKGISVGDFFDMDYGTDRHVYTKNSVSKKILRLVSLGTATHPLGKHAPFPWGMGAGDNMSFRKETFRATGMFDLNLYLDYPVEDLDMFIRILNAGFQLVYDPSAVVYHDYGLSEENKAYRSGVGAGTLLLKYASDPYFRVLYFGRIINILYQIVRRSFRRDKKYCMVRCSYLRGLLYNLRPWLLDI